MLKPQKKITKKEIKEDKLITTYFKARTWVEANRKLVTYIVAAPFVIIALLFWWNQKTDEWNDRANTMLARIIQYYNDGKYDNAINGVPQEGIQGLQAIVDEYGSTNTGEIAKLFLANSYFAQKEYDKALEYYDDISVKDKMLTAAALAGMAACYEVKGESKNAAKYFEKAALKNMSAVQAPNNLHKSAINYATSGNKEKAVELLKKLKKEFPTSTYARDVDRYIAEYSS